MHDKGHTILIVEDEITLRDLLVDTMRKNELLTLQASDGEEGLEKALRERPDLILLDLLMPKMDGMTLLRKLREDAWGKTVPVIVLTNVDPDIDALKEIENNKASYYLIKTKTNMEYIVTKVQELLMTVIKKENR